MIHSQTCFVHKLERMGCITSLPKNMERFGCLGLRSCMCKCICTRIALHCTFTLICTCMYVNLCINVCKYIFAKLFHVHVCMNAHVLYRVSKEEMLLLFSRENTLSHLASRSPFSAASHASLIRIYIYIYYGSHQQTASRSP